MTSQEAREKLAALEVELAETLTRKDALQLELEAAERRIRQLRGSHHGYGEIPLARGRVKECEQIEADESMPKAMILGVPYVIDKVTPKRIFLRKAGGSDVSQYDRDGRPVAQWGLSLDNRIDVVAIADAMGPKRGE